MKSSSHEPVAGRGGVADVVGFILSGAFVAVTVVSSLAFVGFVLYILAGAAWHGLESAPGWVQVILALIVLVVVAQLPGWWRWMKAEYAVFGRGPPAPGLELAGLVGHDRVEEDGPTRALRMVVELSLIIVMPSLFILGIVVGPTLVWWALMPLAFFASLVANVVYRGRVLAQATGRRATSSRTGWKPTWGWYVGDFFSQLGELLLMVVVLFVAGALMIALFT